MTESHHDPTNLTNDESIMVVRARLGPFEIKYPPVKKRMVAGHLVPSLRAAGRFLMAKPRRISVEILSPAQPENGLTEVDEWNPATGSSLEDHDRVVVRIFRAARRGEEEEEQHDDDSVATIESGDEFTDNDGKLWKTSGEHTSSNIVILKGAGSKTTEVKLGSGNDTVVRDLKFASTSDAQKFAQGLATVKQLEAERTQKQIALFKEQGNSSRAINGTTTGNSSQRGGLDLAIGEEINLLAEVVSATDVPAADLSGKSDPYVVVRMNGSEVHKTKSISKTLQPIWTLETGSLFLLQMAPEEFFSSAAGISFSVLDYDTVGSDDLLASVDVPLQEALRGRGERTVYPLTVVKQFAKPGMKKPKLFLRFKPASKADIEFMKSYKSSSKQKYGLYSQETFLPFNAPERKLLKRQEKRGPTKDMTLYRVRPGPDPAREEDETKWMTWENIKKEAVKPSTNWIEAGSGGIGKLFVEIIGCDGLPNMDGAGGLNASDKTDAFCCAVFEDCIVNTDVIGNTLNPRWMPWSQRAFAFNVANPSSTLFLGIFDHDPEMGAGQMVARSMNGSVHDPVGRIIVNTTNFRPGTVYNLQYNIYLGELETHRQKPNGTISIRLRLDFPNVQKAMIESTNPPVADLVAVDRKVDFDVSNYTADGMVDDLDFSVNTIVGYSEELLAYLNVVDGIIESLMTVWLWRPTFVVNKTTKIPLHSLTAFLWGIAVTWNYNLLPSFWLFCVGWILLACNELVCSHPSRWRHCPPYPELFKRLVFGSSSAEKLPAPSPEELMAIEDYEARVQETADRKKKEKEEEEKQTAKDAEEMAIEQELAENAEQMGGKKGGLKLDPMLALKPHLYPIQKQVRPIVYMLRIVKNIVLWGEAYYTFWLVTACFAGSFLLIWVPWSFFIRWSLRIGVFLGLGPWMYFVDKYVFKTNWDMTKEEREAAFKAKMKARSAGVLASASVFMVRKETAVKMKSMKQYMFGKFLVRVPQFREDLFDDIPLPSSTCEPFTDWCEAFELSTRPFAIKQRKFGQQLVGEMIPQREVQCVSKEDESGSKKRSLRFLRGGSKKLGKSSETSPLLGKNQNGYKSAK